MRWGALKPGASVRRGVGPYAAAAALTAMTAWAEATPATPTQLANAIELHWSAPDGCVDRDAVLQRVAAALSDEATRALARGTLERLRASAVITRLGASRRLRLALDVGPAGTDAPATRVLTDDSCDRLTSAGALVLAMTLEAQLASADETAARGGTAASTPSTNRQRFEPQTRTRSVGSLLDRGPASTPRATPVPLSAGLRLAALLDVGTMPALVAPSLAVHAVLEYGALRFALGGRYGLAQLRSADAIDAAVSIELAMAAAQLQGCVDPLRRAVRLGVCAGVELGAQWGRGIGNTAPASGAGVFSAALLGAALEWRPGVLERRMGLSLGLDAVVPLATPEFVIDEIPVFRAAPVGARAMLGLTVLFR